MNPKFIKPYKEILKNIKIENPDKVPISVILKIADRFNLSPNRIKNALALICC